MRPSLLRHCRHLLLRTTDFESIVDVTDGTLYFAKIETKVADTVVIKMRVINDPDSENKDYRVRPRHSLQVSYKACQRIRGSVEASYKKFSW